MTSYNEHCLLVEDTPDGNPGEFDIVLRKDKDFAEGVVLSFSTEYSDMNPELARKIAKKMVKRYNSCIAQGGSPT